MSLFRLDVPREEKPVSQHPWSRIIKDAFSHKVKYAHNSIRNPRYPVKEDKKEQNANAERVKFTIIGDRVTEEFNYCKNLVQGLHKYRRKVFDAPVIRGRGFPNHTYPISNLRCFPCSLIVWLLRLHCIS